MKIVSTIGPLKFTLLSGVPRSLIFPLDMNSGTIQYTYALRMTKKDSFQKVEKAEIILFMSLFSHNMSLFSHIEFQTETQTLCPLAFLN